MPSLRVQVPACIIGARISIHMIAEARFGASHTLTGTFALSGCCFDQLGHCKTQKRSTGDRRERRY